MHQMSLRVVDGYRNALAQAYDAGSVASVFPPLLSRPPDNDGPNQDYLLQILRNAPHISTIYAGYPDGSYLQAIDIETDPKLKTILAAPYSARFAVRSIVQDAEKATSTIRFVDDVGIVMLERSRHDMVYDPRRRPWYRSALRYGKAVSVGPYVTAVLKASTITVAIPMKSNPQIVIGVDMHMEIVSHLLDSKAISSNARSFIFDSSGRLIAHSDPVVMAKIIDTLSNNRRYNLSEFSVTTVTMRWQKASSIF